MRNATEIEGYVHAIRSHITPAGTQAFLIELEHHHGPEGTRFRPRFLVALMHEMCQRANELEPGQRIVVKGKLDTMLLRAQDTRSRRQYINAMRVEVVEQSRRGRREAAGMGA